MKREEAPPAVDGGAGGATAAGAERWAQLPDGVIAARVAADEGSVMLVLADDGRAERAAALCRALLPDVAVAWYPAPDVLPGDGHPASAANVGRRAAAVAVLARATADGRRVVLVTTPDAASRRLPDALPEAMVLKTGEPIEPAALGGALEALGYFTDDRVDEPGEMAFRGGVVDLFPAADDRPLRIDHADGRITGMRRYDPVTQRGEEAVEQAVLWPATDRAGAPPVTDLFAMLPGAALAIEPAAERARASFLRLYNDAGNSASVPVLSPAEWREAIASRDAIHLAPGDEQPVTRFAAATNPGRAFAAAVKSARAAGDRVLLAGGASGLRRMARRLTRSTGEAPQPIDGWDALAAAPPGALLQIEAPMDRGWSAPGLLVIAAADLLGEAAGEGGVRGAIDPFGRAGALHVGDVVIHEEHGVGVLRGLEVVSADGAEHHAVRVEYAKGAMRLVPVAEIGRLWRYGAEEGAVRLDRLDGKSWEARRLEVAASLAASARKLIEIAAAREAIRTEPLVAPADAYERFCAEFGHTLTAGQAAAMEDVRTDLAGGVPMDRLVVGDVGYGKTEVALRAAAIVALAGRQVAVAAPTTVLARQHLETFRRRFEPLGLAVAGLSRLTDAAEARRVREGLADGSIAVVIGTQAVAGKDVRFAKLALTVIDEEQRFGAADKARLRGLAEGSHTLSLTATPIPRTLQAAMVGIQALSLITTPPARRQPIRTSVATFDEVTVRAALMRERSRRGQSFVVVPRVEDMAPLRALLERLVPELEVTEAHGSMKAAEIDESMVGFAGGKGDVLLATNIIEAGLDVPRANTMIVWHADRFGLSQLHQLRGRVGRAERRGHVLLTTEPGSEIAPATAKRLRTLEALDQLGAGFAVSVRDLDLRGAGDLVGEEQAGHMKLVGVDLYQHLMGLALAQARGEPAEDWTPDLHLGEEGRLDADWLPEEDVRIELYSRLARLGSPAELEALVEEVADRFGEPPPAAARLFERARLRLLAVCARVARVDAGPAAIALTPRPDLKADPVSHGLTEKNGRLILAERIEEDAAREGRVADLLAALCESS